MEALISQWPIYRKLWFYKIFVETLELADIVKTLDVDLAVITSVLECYLTLVDKWK